jgi:heterodisulfide reductase subunit A-like polyferredoxin
LRRSDFSAVARRPRQAGAILTATGCGRRREYFDYLGYGHDGVVTQVELAEMLDSGGAGVARPQPVEELVMVQCAARATAPPAALLASLLHDRLKHAIRLKTLFPAMKVTICYLELRTAGIGYENWFLAARRAGVEFLRGTPPEVQFVPPAGSDRGEDVTAARTRATAGYHRYSAPAWCRPVRTSSRRRAVDHDKDDHRDPRPQNRATGQAAKASSWAFPPA